MVPLDFHYLPICSAGGCTRPALYKVAAPWSDGTSRELKGYGLACDDHKASQLVRGQLHRAGLVVADGETVGEVGLFALRADARDAELARLPDHRG